MSRQARRLPEIVSGSLNTPVKSLSVPSGSHSLQPAESDHRSRDSRCNATKSKLTATGLPQSHGLYSAETEHDSCGVGFVAHIKGAASRQIVEDAARMLVHMTHRGACGCEENTGDGAGIMTALPDAFLRKVARRDLGVDLPKQGMYGAGVVFLPRDSTCHAEFKAAVNTIIAMQGQKLIGWRKLPQDPVGADIGPSAVAAEPSMEMLFVGAASGLDQEAFERQLFVIRKAATHKIRESSHPLALAFYACTLSSKVLVYKGMLTPAQVLPYYPDLRDPDYQSHFAMVHSRFSTNTFPSWDRAHPQRFMSHNGEINTVKGNANWM